MEIIDIIKSENYQAHVENLAKLCSWIKQNDRHRNASNYYNLQNFVHKFDSFEIIYDDNNIVAFSGLWNAGTYPSHIARCCTRTYYHPDYRSSTTNRNVRWSEDWFIPYEIKRAKELGYDYAFISIELLMRRRAMIDLINYLDDDWILHEDMCNTCRQHNDTGTYIGVNKDAGCWQNVCYKQLVTPVHTPFDLPSISILDYNKDYAHTQKEKLQRLR